MSSGTARKSEGLSETRNAGRTFGCMGLSMVVHVAFLAFMSILPFTAREMSADDAKSGNDGTVSIMETTGATPLDEVSATAVTAPVEVAQPVIADADAVIQPVEKTVVKKTTTVAPKVVAPIAKPAAAAKAVAPAAPEVMTDDAQAEPMPTLLANPPGDEAAGEESEETSTDESSDEATSPVAAAPIAAAPVAAAVPTEALAADETADGAQATASNEAIAAPHAEAPPVAAASGGAAAAPGGASAGSGGGSSGAVVGPIRDASDLKALPGNTNPVYPARDRLARKQGTAVIIGHVSADGRITEMKLEKSSGSQNMDAAAVQAFRTWRFREGQQGWIRKPFEFRLVGEAKEVPAPLGKTLKR